MKKILLAALATLASSAYAYNEVDGKRVWQFSSADGWPAGYYQNTGKPRDLTWTRDEYPAEFFQRIANALPEQEINEAFLTDDEGANILLEEEAEVFVTFIHEGAGYKNSFGYFTYDPANPPATPADVDEIIVFPNLSYPHLANGHRALLGTFPAGTAIGFAIVANGFWYYTGVHDRPKPIYYSLKHLNPDPEGLKQHNVLLYDAEVEEVILGFEDLPRTWGDNDFNDAVFSVSASPATAINTAVLTEVPDANDSDADGVPDADDEYPNDYERAYASNYPSALDWYTWAFEDNWPRRGDHDMNDLVVRERTQLIYNADNLITGFAIQGFIDARGAAFKSGFGLRIGTLSETDVKSSSITIAGNTYSKLPESGHQELVYQLWSNTHTYTQTGQTGRCSHFNTLKDCPELPPVPFSLDVRLMNPVTNLQESDFDFFLFLTHYRGREIHLPDVEPTAKFDFTQLGKYDDTSDEGLGRFFRTESNLPWALKINTRWYYPREYIDVKWAYPDYETWVESDGAEATDWYNTSDRSTHYFVPSDE